MSRQERPPIKRISALIIAVFFLSSTVTLAMPFGAANSTGMVEETVETSNTAEFPYPGDDWAWSMIGSEYAHQRGEYGEEIVVAVLDTGIDYNHPDLEDKMWEDIGYDFVDDDDDPMDEHGHGTHVAGIIASVAPQAELMALRVIEEEGGDWVDVSKAVEYARNNGADIISMSFGGQYSAFTPAFELQMERAYELDDILHVAAAGNDDSDEKFYPAGYDSVISVSAVNSDREKAYYSNRGDWIELTAPGGGSEKQVFSTLPNEEYGEKAGTSMACPFVTGAAALRRSLKPGESNDEVRGHLQNTAIDLGNEEYYGHGLVNAYRAAGGEIPTPVQNLEADPGDSVVELHWEEPWHNGASPIEGFRVYRADSGEEKELLDEVGPEEYGYEDTDVENGVTYQYTVTAYNAEGESLESEVVSATPRAEPVAPSTPREVSVELLEKGVEVSWKEPLDDGGSDIERYLIYRGKDEEGFDLIDEVDSETTTYLDNSVSLGNEYVYGVTAENEVGESEKAETDPIFIPEDHGPSSPEEVTAEVLDEGVEISWEHPEDSSSITYYNIYREGLETDGFEWLGEVDPEETSYLDKTVSPGSEYTYAVTAENELGESEKVFSELVTVPEDHDPSPTEPSSPRNVEAELIDEGVEMIWEEPTDDGGSSITGYKVYRKEAGEDNFTMIGEVDAGSNVYLDDTVSADSEYVYAVSAVNDQGMSEKAHSSTVTVPEDYTPEPLEDGDEGWIDKLMDEDLYPIYFVIAIGILLVVIASLAAHRKKR
ncbi:MAG: S8 family serine peptidase [Candidatus Natronoplasma sp.]